MKEPKRLTDEHPNGYVAALIRTGQREGPTPAVRRASALVAGVAAAGTFAPKAAAATSTLTALFVAGAKGMVAGILVVSAVVGVPQLITARGPTPEIRQERAAPTARSIAHHAATETPASSPGIPPVAPEPPRDVPPLAAAPNNAARTTARPTPPEPLPRPTEAQQHVFPTTSVAAPRIRLADEVQAFERARSAFARGDIATAASELAHYERDFSSGALSLEAQVLRIEILEARGDHAAARALATAFLQANPSAPASRRVRKLLAQGGSEPFR